MDTTSALIVMGFLLVSALFFLILTARESKANKELLRLERELNIQYRIKMNRLRSAVNGVDPDTGWPNPINTVEAWKALVREIVTMD